MGGMSGRNLGWSNFGQFRFRGQTLRKKSNQPWHFNNKSSQNQILILYVGACPAFGPSLFKFGDVKI